MHTLQPEFNDTKHVKGIVSMARGDDPASATTSFFIVTGDASSLDNKYTVFGRVVDGMAAVDAMDAGAGERRDPGDAARAEERPDRALSSDGPLCRSFRR